MHYYKRNLGDYAKKAGRLSMLQHGAYTLLIDACYDREQFPTLEEAIEWTWASTTAEIEAVEFVLRKFFSNESGVYVQKRIQEEIAEYHKNAEKNKRTAQERERNRREKITNRERSVHEACTKRARSVHESPPNQEPLTINQEPLEKHKPISQLALLKSKNIPEPLARDWLAIRKAKKSPLTESTLAGTEREAVKAGISLEEAIRIACENTWAGFKAEYIEKPKARASPTFQDPRADVMRAIWNGGKRERDITGEVDGKVIPAVFERIR